MNCAYTHNRHQQRGFTLLELLISMGLMIVVLAIAGQAFNQIYSLSSRFSKSEETNIEGAIGLEVMRHDLEQMGFGLPWGFSTPITYSEATDSVGATLNDSNSVPRSFVGLKTAGAFSSAYLGIKGVTVGLSKTSQRWSCIPFHNISTASGKLSQPVTWPTNNLQTTDNIIVVRSNFNDPTDDHLLVVSGASFSSLYSTTLNSNFLPTTDQQTHMLYGIDTVAPRMPFNRADYFIKIPDSTTGGSLPTFCEQSTTGELYKGVVSHSDGSYNYLPLLNCVADMQVVLGWDSSDFGNANNVNVLSNADGSTAVTITGTAVSSTTVQGWLQSPQGIREHLKMVKVYILAQEGKRDSNYTAPSITVDVGGEMDPASLKHSYTLSAAQMNYRWRLYRIIARPKNLLSNQH